LGKLASVHLPQANSRLLHLRLFRFVRDNRVFLGMRFGAN
jgi:hypothetical protein